MTFNGNPQARRKLSISLVNMIDLVQTIYLSCIELN